MHKMVELDRSEIVSGRPLPFSIYDADRRILLAARGQVVSDAMRERLRNHRLFAIADEVHRQGVKAQQDEISDSPPICPLERLRQQQAKAASTTRVGFRIARDDRSENYTSWVIGVGARRNLLLTVPSISEQSYLNINEGQTWTFRTFHAVAAVRFSAIVERVIFDPFPYFHIALPATLEMRHVRKLPRVAVCLDASLMLDTPIEAVVVDLSAEGMCVAVPKDKDQTLQPDEQLEVRLRLPIMEETHDLQIKGTVMRRIGSSDPAHSDLAFFGLSLEPQTPFERIMLHACVQERLAKDLDAFSRVLAC